jgi:hypothetical protein
VLKQYVNFGTLLIGAEGTRLLREDGAGETPQALKAPRRLPGPPAESEVPGVESNRPCLTRPIKIDKHLPNNCE